MLLFCLVKLSYVWMLYSDDDGRIWLLFRDIIVSFCWRGMKFLGIGFGKGIVLKWGLYVGCIIIFVYFMNWKFYLRGL